jgi:hypothetical protein
MVDRSRALRLVRRARPLSLQEGSQPVAVKLIVYIVRRINGATVVEGRGRPARSAWWSRCCNNMWRYIGPGTTIQGYNDLGSNHARSGNIPSPCQDSPRKSHAAIAVRWQGWPPSDAHYSLLLWECPCKATALHDPKGASNVHPISMLDHRRWDHSPNSKEIRRPLMDRSLVEVPLDGRYASFVTSTSMTQGDPWSAPRSPFPFPLPCSRRFSLT